MHRKMKTPAIAAVALAMTIGVTACAPGATGEQSGQSESATYTSPVTADQVAELGDVTLRVWADAGEQATLDAFVPTYEKAFPNVTVDITYKGWDDLMGTVVNAMNSSTAPDIANGNQGFAIMGTMVKGKMLRPIDDLIDAYGIAEGLPDSGFGPNRWNDEGTQWGEGPIYGQGGATQPLGLFSNKAKLEALGIEAPQSIQELDKALQTAKDAGEIPIMLGNSDQYPLGSHVLGILIDMYASPEEVNEWLAGDPDATFDTPGIRKAVDKLAEWGSKGYFAEGYDGRSLDDAVSAYAGGEGVFFLGGSFNGSKLAQTDPDAFGFSLLKGETGTYTTTGTFGTPWLISSKTKVEPAAVAFLGMLLSKDSAQIYADQSRLPNADLSGVTPTGEMHRQQLEAARKLFDGGEFVGYLDWATPTMQRTLGAGAQELLDGSKTSDDFIQSVQEDWTSFQAERK